mmetsp:Transcript_79550/g.138024  ORF Transcript_79550/g.138024 Transcript_79550/m.138024 type:complete len:187 (+) Transcript_79550:245-805(+)
MRPPIAVRLEVRFLATPDAFRMKPLRPDEPEAVVEAEPIDPRLIGLAGLGGGFRGEALVFAAESGVDTRDPGLKGGRPPLEERLEQGASRSSTARGEEALPTIAPKSLVVDGLMKEKEGFRRCIRFTALRSASSCPAELSEGSTKRQMAARHPSPSCVADQTSPSAVRAQSRRPFLSRTFSNSLTG